MRKRAATIKYGASLVSVLLLAALLCAALPPCAACAEATPTPAPTFDPQTGRVGGLLYFGTLRALLREGQTISDSGYTSQSWQRFTEAMEAGERCLTTAYTQYEVDDTADALREAMEALRYPDRDRLRNAISEGKGLAENSEVGAAWQALFDALDEGESLVDSGDQEAINACADKLWALIAQIEDSLEGTLVIYQDRPVALPAPQAEPSPEAPAEAPEEETAPRPSWSLYVLLGISLALNAVLALVFIYLPHSKKNEVDNTPVVDYYIGDDG